MVLILTSAFKGLLRDLIMNPPEWSFHTIQDVIEASPDYKIYAPLNKITYYSIKKRSNYDPNFKKLLKKFNLLAFKEIFSFDFGKRFYRRKIGVFATSLNWETQKYLGGSEVVIDEVRYDHVLDVRLIRSDFEFSDQMVQL